MQRCVWRFANMKISYLTPQRNKLMKSGVFFFFWSPLHLFFFFVPACFFFSQPLYYFLYEFFTACITLSVVRCCYGSIKVECRSRALGIVTKHRKKYSTAFRYIKQYKALSFLLYAFIRHKNKTIIHIQRVNKNSKKK